MSEYLPIPVAEAIALSERFGKSMVVILAYDPVHQLTHTTTYGVLPAEKQMSADVGDRCTKLICKDGFKERTTFEDFRLVDQAKRAKLIEELTRAAQAADYALGSVLACREGPTDELLTSVREAIGKAIDGAARTPLATDYAKREAGA